MDGDTRSTSSLSGILSAVTTPLSSDGSTLRSDAVQALVDFQCEKGVDALVVGGSTGEQAYLTTDERLQSTEDFARAAGSRIPLIMQVGAVNETDALLLARRASELGSEAVLVLPPYYDALRMSDVFSYFDKVAQASWLPIVLYHIPRITGIEFSVEELRKLKRECNVQFMKDSCGDLTTFLRLLDDPESPTMLGGSDGLLFASLCSGARGAIIGASSFLPDLCADLYRAVAKDSDLGKARAAWDRLWPLRDFLMRRGYVPSTKAGCELRGVAVGGTRAPVAAASAEDQAALKQALVDAGVEL
jgi:dihydrodipicolinate synthase/N-acetylneuraminate lyase